MDSNKPTNTKYCFSDGIHAMKTNRTLDQCMELVKNEIQNNSVSPKVKVWREGLDEWKSPYVLAEFKDLFPSNIPPPVPQETNLMTNLSVVLVVVFLVLVVVGSLAIAFGKENVSFGDVFTGIGALFGGFAFVGVVASIVIQRRELKFQLHEMKEQKKAMEMQAKQLELQKEEMEEQNKTMAKQQTYIEEQTNLLKQQIFNQRMYQEGSINALVNNNISLFVEKKIDDLNKYIENIYFKVVPFPRKKPYNDVRSYDGLSKIITSFKSAFLDVNNTRGFNLKKKNIDQSLMCIIEIITFNQTVLKKIVELYTSYAKQIDSIIWKSSGRMIVINQNRRDFEKSFEHILVKDLSFILYVAKHILGLNHPYISKEKDAINDLVIFLENKGIQAKFYK